ncbi:protein lev-9-like isoform X3 [Apostichopus japonicus]|uniref:protein lev-9-like isoform X3 n=1 Tax=Stichopus japonicus TaxID=307972 RepID=UPI003AB30150
MNLSKCCFFFIVLFTGSVAQQSCPTRNVTATCTDKSCADTRTCRKVGRTCQCVDNCGWSCVRIGCEFFEAPENGNVIYDPVNRTVGSTATFSCSSGYVLSGNASLECLETKEWNATNDVSCVAECNRDETQVTVLRRTCMKTCVTAGDCLRGRPCVCDGVCGLSCIPTARVNYCDVTLVQVDNTVVTLDPATLVFGTVATISCSPGHLPIGGTREIQRSCLGNGDWSDGSLTCIPSDACRNPPEIENASHDVKLYYANGESLRYSCNSGYASGSNSYLRCVDGNWSEANIRCIGKSCGHPGDIDNGYFIGRVYSFPNSVTYECNEGFELNGRPTRNCQTTQEWDGIAPSCSPVQCSPPDATENGRKDGSGTDYNDRVSFSCDQGFSLHGESVLICQGDGTWSADVPECTDTCRNPPEIENASHDVKQSYANGERLHYSCNLGYVLGSNSYMQCVDGSWLEQDINCRAVQCRALDTPVNGSKYGSGNGYNDRVAFTCDQGFSLHGESVLTCQSNGTWSADVPVCTSDACRNPPEIENASHDDKQSYANGERLFYSCNAGYEPVSSSYLQCVDGNWSEADIRCTAKTCGQPGDINNGGIIEEVYTFPNSVTYVCNEGFTLNGRTTRTCQANQHWSGIAPSCNPVKCPMLDAPEDGRKDGSGTGYNDRVEFSCDQGFSLNGESVLTCQGDGTWSADVPECTGYCQKPREDVMWVFNDSCQGISVQPNKCGLSYLCDDGYFPINQKVIWSCSKGIWQKNAEPICSTASCNSTDLPYGDVNENQRTVQVIPLRELVGTLTRNGEYIRVKCPEGYEHRGSRYMKCKEGEWTPSKKHSFPGRPPLCINV